MDTPLWVLGTGVAGVISALRRSWELRHVASV
jgi:hypothetical protein